jgi:hypothetical protein
MNDLFPILNLEQARFECTYGRGCEGECCRNGRPAIYPEDGERIDANLHKVLPELRPEARRMIEKRGYRSGLITLGLPMMRMSRGWCVFFNQGCVLHKVGAAEGDRNRYKPSVCSLFPIEQDAQDRWYVRQKGYKGEKWDLFCLDPASSPVRAADSLRDEIELVRRFDEAERRDGQPG